MGIAGTQLLIGFLLFLFGVAGGFGAATYTTPQTQQGPQGFVVPESFDERTLFFPTELFFHSALARSDWSASVKGQVVARSDDSFTLGEVDFDDNSKLALVNNGQTLEVRYVSGETRFFEFPVVPSESESIEGKLLEKTELEFSSIKVGDILFGNVDFATAEGGSWKATGRIFSVNNHLKP